MRPRPHLVGKYRDEKGELVDGRVVVDECPEGLARLAGRALERIEFAERFGLPGPWPGQDRRFLQALTVIGRAGRG